MDFQVTDLVRMKSSLEGIDTYGITRSVIHRHRNTIFRVRDYHTCDNGDRVVKFYGLGRQNELRMAFWNPDMFTVIDNTY